MTLKTDSYTLVPFLLPTLANVHVHLPFRKYDLRQSYGPSTLDSVYRDVDNLVKLVFTGSFSLSYQHFRTENPIYAKCHKATLKSRLTLNDQLHIKLNLLHQYTDSCNLPENKVV